MPIIANSNLSSSVANQTFLDKTIDDEMAGELSLNAPASGAQVTNTQQAINDNIDNIAQNASDIAQNTSDISDINTSKGQPNGFASLDGNGQVPLTEMNPAVLGGPKFVGTWDADTNTPTLSNGGGTTNPDQGDYYRVSVAGSTSLDGISDWGVGDWVIFNGTAWDKIDNSESVTSFNGRKGAIVPEAGDYTASDVGLGNVTNDAQLTRAAGDFDTFTSKATPVAADIVLIEDSADSFNKKKITLTDLLGGGASGSREVLATSSNTVLTNSDDVAFVGSASGNTDITLPAYTEGKVFRIHKLSDANSVTIFPDAGDTIDGQFSFVLSIRFDYVELIGSTTANTWTVNARSQTGPQNERVSTFASTQLLPLDVELCLLTGGSQFTYTMPDATVARVTGKPIKIKCNTANGAIIDFTGGQDANGLTSLELREDDFIELTSDGTNYVITSQDLKPLVIDKFLTADISVDTIDVADLRVLSTDLIPNRKLKIIYTMQAQLVNAAADNLQTFINVNGAAEQRTIAGGNDAMLPMYSVVVEALDYTTGNITFDMTSITAGNFVRGNGANTETWAQIIQEGY